MGLGGRLNRRYWHQGCATEVGAALLAAGFDAGLARIIAVPRPEDQPAITVCERLGMAVVERCSYFGSAKGQWLLSEALARVGLLHHRQSHDKPMPDSPSPAEV